MLKKRDRGKDKAGRPKKNLEEQAQDIMRSSDLEELEKAEIPEELRDRLEGADVGALDDLEQELGFNVQEPSERPPEEDEAVDLPPPQTGEQLQETVDNGGQEEESIDASCTVKVSEDRMSALVSLYPSQHGGKLLDFATVKDELDSTGVVFGINEELLKKLIITVEKTHEEKEGVIIAKGQPPDEGKDGIIVYHFGEDEAILEQSDEEQDNE